MVKFGGTDCSHVRDVNIGWVVRVSQDATARSGPDC